MAKHQHSNLAAFTYLVFFAPTLTDHKNDEFVKYHMYQAMGLVIFALTLQGIISILGYWGFGPHWLLVWPVRLVLLYELFIGMSNALNGEMHLLPWIGEYAKKLFA